MADIGDDEGGAGSPALKKRRSVESEDTADGSFGAAVDDTSAVAEASSAVPHAMFTGFAFDWTRYVCLSNVSGVPDQPGILSVEDIVEH